MLHAEELLLLTLNPDGTPARTGTADAVDLAVAGALVIELAESGALRIDDGRVHVVAGAPRPQHPLLVAALDAAADQDGKRLRSRLHRIAKQAGRRQVIDHLVAVGILGREKAGALHVTHHPVTAPIAHAALVARARAAARAPQGSPLTTPDAVLLALAGPAYQLEVVAPDRSERRDAKQRIAEALDLVPVAGLVKKAIDESVSVAVVVGA